VLLADQDRSLWNADQIAAGTALAEEALSGDAAGPYALQAAIAAEHVRPDSAGGPRWRRVAELYARLYEVHQSPVVRLNGAVAVAMANGPARGLELIDRIDGLDRYHLLHSARRPVASAGPRAGGECRLPEGDRAHRQPG
jgi:predicted RNA polymerase sigma factor